MGHARISTTAIYADASGDEEAAFADGFGMRIDAFKAATACVASVEVRLEKEIANL